MLRNSSYQDFQTMSLIVSTTCIIFYPFLEWLVKQYLFNPWCSHALIVPVAAVFIFYREKKGVSLVEEEGNAGLIVGTVLMAISLIEMYARPSVLYKLGALIMYIVGCSTFFYGIQILPIIIKPALYLLFMYPVFPNFLLNYGASLLTLTGRITFESLRMFGLNPQYSEAPLPVISFISSSGEKMAFTVDVPCMGAFMLIGFMSFAVFLSLVTDGSWLRKCSSLFLGVLLMVLLNILRVITICVIGYSYGLELALQGFHVFGGWMLFAVGISIYLTVNSRLIRKM